MSKDDDDPHKSESKSGLRVSGRYDWLTNFHGDLMAGAVMGGVVHTIVAPIERSKLILQTQESNLGIVGGSGRRRFKGMLDCIVRTVRDEGILSLWRGNGSSVLRYYPSVALNFSLKVPHLIEIGVTLVRKQCWLTLAYDMNDEMLRRRNS